MSGDISGKNMRILWLMLIGWVVVVSVGTVDYGDRNNWVIRDLEIRGGFDVFYVYPTLVASREHPLMDWRDPQVAAKTRGFARAQTTAILGEVRIFAPYVRQLEFRRCIDELRRRVPWADSGMRVGMDDTVAAFDYYLRHWNQGRPFVLMGHSQGAIDLYWLLKTRRDITPERGFIAAYLPGLPGLTGEVFARDFAGRAIRPARGAEEIGVIVSWNTLSPRAAAKFAGRGALCINPLNWRTDATPASAELNTGAFFYDYRTGETERQPRVCGATVDPERGVLLVDLPENSRYDAKGQLGMGVFHGSDIWLFADNIRANMHLRAAVWRKKFARKTAAPKRP